MKVYHYDENMLFDGEIERQIDQLETKKAGHKIYLMPANATEKEPPEAKEGFRIKWNGEGWIYEEIKKDQKPEPYKPTEKDKLIERLYQIDEEFKRLDYVGIKIATGRATKEDYSHEIESMEELAEEKNRIKDKIKEIERKEE